MWSRSSPAPPSVPSSSAPPRGSSPRGRGGRAGPPQGRRARVSARFRRAGAAALSAADLRLLSDPQARARGIRGRRERRDAAGQRRPHGPRAPRRRHQEELKTLVPAVEEVRDFLLAELDVKHLRDLAKVVAGQHGKAGAVLGPSLKPLASPYTLQKLLATVPKGEEPPDSLVELLDLLSRYGADLLESAARSDRGRRRRSHVEHARQTSGARAQGPDPRAPVDRRAAADRRAAQVLEPGAQQEAAKKLLASEHAGAQLAA